MYRELQEIQRRIPAMEEKIRDAILAGTTRDMLAFSGEAHALAEDLKFDLDHLLNSGGSGEGEERRFAQAALDSLDSAILNAQKVALGTDVDEVRARLIDFKTRADYTNAYLHAALGYEME